MSDSPRAAPKKAAPKKPAAGSLLERTADVACERLNLLLISLFSATDDLFFDLASRARSNHDQNLYFEALREVRLKKNSMVEIFFEEVRAWFAALDPSKPVKRRSTVAANFDGVENLSLVGTDQVEKESVLTDMTSRQRADWQNELFQTEERLRQLSKKNIDGDTNPLDPAQLGDAFYVASQALDFEFKIQKILLKQFERSVLEELDDVLIRSNQFLIDHGVLPSLTSLGKRRIKKRPETATRQAASPPASAVASPASHPTDRTVGGSEPAGGHYVGQAEYEELTHLLGRMRASGLKLPMFPELPQDANAPVMPKEELVSVLSDLQALARDAGEAKPLDIRNAIESIATQKGSFQIQQADEDVINVVAMFFDIILDDRNLPVEIQALVSRLQIPILKVALRDRSFFSNRHHPARQLLNEIARTSIGWEASDKNTQDALYIRLTELVEEVLGEYEEHVEVFEKCLNELMGFIERQDKRADKLEKRTTEQAAAQARSAKSRELVKIQMQERLADKVLPAQISRFLVEEWQQVLFLTHLKHGPESPDWIDALQTLDDLIWSVQKHEDERSQNRLERLLPDLQKRIAKGLESVEATPEQAQVVLKQVIAVQDKLRKKDFQAIESAPIAEELKVKIDPKREPAQRPWNEMTAVERQQVKYQSLMFEQLKKVDGLEPGTWLQYEDLRQGVSRRCKLSAKILATETFVFVNRVGAKVFEKPRKSFAYDLQMGYAKVLESTPLFDRTISTITGNLRKLAEA